MHYLSLVTESLASPRPGFYEFFCGGGMARVEVGRHRFPSGSREKS
ncbi:MAG: hypothetical protein ABR929_03735 [Roseiarcus sp.]|jgi:hypothetical protein